MEAGNLERKYTGVFDEHVMTVHNGRAKQEGFSLDRHGFEFIEHLTKVENFFDPNELTKVYYPEVEKIVQRLQVSRVVIFDHTIRSGNRASREERDVCASRCTESIMIILSGLAAAAADILPDEAQDLLQHRCVQNQSGARSASRLRQILWQFARLKHCHQMI